MDENFDIPYPYELRLLSGIEREFAQQQRKAAEQQRSVGRERCLTWARRHTLAAVALDRWAAELETEAELEEAALAHVADAWPED